MNRADFLKQLRKGLSGLPKQDIEERLSFYGEMIDDRMEEGLSEEDAIRAIGSVDSVVAQAIADASPAKNAPAGKSAAQRSSGRIVLLLILSPVLLALGLAALSVLVALYAVLWSLVLSLWAIFIAFIASAVGGFAAGIILCAQGKVTQGILFISAAAVLAGLSIFTYYGCKAVTGATATFSAKSARWIGNRFTKKKEVA